MILDKIKFIASFSILAELYVIIFCLKDLRDIGTIGIPTIGFTLMVLDDMVVPTGILLIIILLLAIPGYFSLKKKYHYLREEMNILLDSISKYRHG